MNTREPMTANDIGQKFNDGSIYELGIKDLREYLAILTTTHSNADDGRRYAEMANNIRHLLFLHQTKEAHQDSMKATRVALIVAIASAAASVAVAIATICSQP